MCLPGVLGAHDDRLIRGVDGPGISLLWSPPGVVGRQHQSVREACIGIRESRIRIDDLLIPLDGPFEVVSGSQAGEVLGLVKLALEAHALLVRVGQLELELACDAQRDGVG